MRVLGGNTEDLGDDFFNKMPENTDNKRKINKWNHINSQTKIFQKPTIKLEGSLEMWGTSASCSPAMMLNIHHSKESLPAQQKRKG